MGPTAGDVHVNQPLTQISIAFLQNAANFVADLEHWQFNSFQIRWRDSVKYNFPRGFVNFTIDATGKPMQMVIDQPNNDFWFYELELFRVEPDETK